MSKLKVKWNENLVISQMCIGIFNSYFSDVSNDFKPDKVKKRPDFDINSGDLWLHFHFNFYRTAFGKSALNISDIFFKLLWQKPIKQTSDLEVKSMVGNQTKNRSQRVLTQTLQMNHWNNIQRYMLIFL